MSGDLHGYCIRCGKTHALVRCQGCEQSFCFAHVIDHQHELSKQLEDLINEEKQLRESSTKNDDSHPIFAQIDQWRRDSIEEIKRISRQTKEELRLLLSKSNDEHLQRCSSIQTSLQQLKISEDFNEKQLKRITEQFNELKTHFHSFELNKSSNIPSLQIRQPSKETAPVPLPPAIVSPSSPSVEEIHTHQQGSVRISCIDRYGYFISIEHTGSTTTKDEDMVGWTLKRSTDSQAEVVFQFPNEFLLKTHSSIKILSKRASQSRYSYDVANCLVAEQIPTWGTAVHTTTNILCDAKGDQRDVVTQTFK